MDNEAFTTLFHSAKKVSKNEALNLSIVFGRHTFMFAIFTSDYKNCYEIGHVQIKSASKSNSDLANHLVFLLNDFQLKQKLYDKVSVTILSQDFTLIPEAFSEKLDGKSTLLFTNGKTEQNAIRHHKLNGLDYVHALELPVISTIESAFQSCSTKHAGAVAINLCASHHSLLNLDLFLNVQDSTFEIVFKENNVLKFYNSLRFENNEDVLYYLLFTMEQFGLNPMHVKLGIAGQVEANGELAKSIKRYIKNVQFCAFHPSIQLDKDLASLPNHFYFTLLNQHLCEL